MFSRLTRLIALAVTLFVSGSAFADNLTPGTSIIMGSPTAGIVFKQGANSLCGTFTNNGTTPVTTANTSVAISDAIVISLNTVGGTVGVQPHIATITAATGFTTIATASDTSIMNYCLLKNAP